MADELQRQQADGKEVILSVRNLSKSFGALRVVQDVSFELARGEVLGVLGPNGAGKTSLFNLISGDISFDSGSITLDGASLDREPSYRRAARGIGRTYQIPRPYAKMTTFENLLVASRFAAGRSEREAYQSCAGLLEDCGLAGKANLPAGGLTLLDRKRLELARALAGEPKLLLLDEIAGGLTEAEAGQLVSLIRHVRDRGVTIIWIEHVLHAVMAVAERLLVLSFGQKIADGAPQAVIDNPDVRRIYMGIEA
ncbi:ABC transporter ATP-binding protein [Agrobacterium tumefaciens]|uniref:ABC transporter ATP-binding protein n=1 Tax=Agrobacterium tumefaciens TaxID=358 RepID=A0A4D7Z0V6_AGRTU|nr:ABC transporter ATP-binding protein [Agrobacterium tumefaciens]QCL97662.1 ABC transporter ATP-binding protein [Agrobacterium tumefaciens]